VLGAQFFGCRLGARLPEDADDLFLAESLSFHEVCGVDITTQTPVQACLLFGEQVIESGTPLELQVLRSELVFT